MVFFLRILPYLAGSWLAAGDLLAVTHPDRFWWFAIAAIVGPVLSLWLITRGGKLPRGFGSIYFFPVFTLVPAMGALLFSEHAQVQIAFAIGSALVMFVFLEQAFRFRYQPARYAPNALVNLSYIFAIVGMFFAGLTLFDLQVFANLPLWVVTSIFFVLVLVWFVGLHALAPLERRRAQWWGVGIVIVMTEMFALFAWLPAIPLAKAGMFGLLVTYVVQQYRSDALTDKTTQRWAFVLLFVMLLLLVATTHWFA